MNARNAILGVTLLLVAGALAWIFAGGGLAVLGIGEEAGTRPGHVAPVPATADDADPAHAGAGDAADPASRRKEAVLFARPLAERRGVGALVARILRGKDRAPVAKAAVFLTGTGNDGKPVSLRVESDERGVASLATVPAGEDYLLRVEASEQQGTWLPGVPVRPGETKDLGDLVVGAKAVLLGKVVDEAGKAIRGARVVAYPGYGNLLEMMGNIVEILGNLDREPKPLVETKTDAEGRFRLEEVPSGTIVVAASAASRAPVKREVSVVGGRSAAGEIAITLPLGASITGKVVDDAGRGVPAARLAVIEEKGGPDAFLLGRTFAVAGDDGSFEIVVSDDAKSLRAFVAAEGYPTGYSQRLEPDSKDVRIVLLRGATLEVLVETKADHRGVEGAQVLAMLSDAGGMERPDSTGTLLFGLTGADGKTTLVGRPGRVEMLMVTSSAGMAMGSPSREIGSFMGGDSKSFEIDVPKELEAGKTHRGVVRLGGGTYSMEGRVLDPQGNGLAGVSVKPFSMMGLGAGKSVLSASDGAYRVDGLSLEMPALLVLRAPGWVQRMSQGDLSDMTGDAKPKPGDVVKKDWTMTAAATVRGRVVDAQGAPVPDARVRASSGSSMSFLGEVMGDAGAMTATDGSYVLFDVDPTGEKVTVWAAADGFVSGKTKDVAVAVGGSATAPDLVLSRGATIRGVVLDASGRPAAGARVEVSTHRDDGDPMESMRDMMRGGTGRAVRTGADGSFVVPTVAAGTTTLTATAEGAAAARRTVKVEAEKDPARVELRLKASGRVTGTVVDAQGKAVANASVGVEGGGEDDAYVAPKTSTTGSDGGFALDGLPLGRVSVQASAAGHVPSTAEATVGGPPVEIRLGAVSAADASRLREIDKEIAAISTKIGDVKSDAEREALTAKLMQLMQEKSRLQKAGVTAAPAGEDDVPGSDPAMR
jgi:protocatechuate 3,4-dioxygenase beta subunit